MTKEQQAWIKRVQKAVDVCPGKGWGFYTIGDRGLQIYDRAALINSGHYDEDRDLVACISYAENDGYDIDLGRIEFPMNVEGVCG